MEDPDRAADFIPAGLAALGIEADEVELAIIEAARGLFWPPLRELLELDVAAVEPEGAGELSSAPRDL